MCEHARTSKCVGCAWPTREKLSLGAREQFKCLQNKINKMNLPKNAVLFAALLLSLKPRYVNAISYFRVEKVDLKRHIFRHFLLPCFQIM